MCDATELPNPTSCLPDVYNTSQHKLDMLFRVDWGDSTLAETEASTIPCTISQRQRYKNMRECDDKVCFVHIVMIDLFFSLQNSVQ